MAPDLIMQFAVTSRRMRNQVSHNIAREAYWGKRVMRIHTIGVQTLGKGIEYVSQLTFS